LTRRQLSNVERKTGRRSEEKRKENERDVKKFRNRRKVSTSLSTVGKKKKALGKGANWLTDCTTACR